MNFSVGLFLFLSGLLSTADGWNPKKRIKKVLIPYIMWTAIYVVFNNVDALDSVPMEFVKNLLTVNSAAMMYYIPVYIQLTLLIPVFDKVARSKYKWWIFLISPLEIVLMRMIPMIAGTELPKVLTTIQHISCVGWVTYFYLGYLLGNDLIKIKQNNIVKFLLPCSVVLQMIEGYWYYFLGNVNCGTQLKLSSLLTGCLVAMLAVEYIRSGKRLKSRLLKLMGDNSFGIYFSHIAIMKVLGLIPLYSELIFPIKVVAVIAIDLLCIEIGKKILGRRARYLAL